MTKPRTIKKSDDGKWKLLANGEVWKTGRYGYMAGYCSHPDNFESAVDGAEEEARVLAAECRAEFGL